MKPKGPKPFKTKIYYRINISYFGLRRVGFRFGGEAIGGIFSIVLALFAQGKEKNKFRAKCLKVEHDLVR